MAAQEVGTHRYRDLRAHRAWVWIKKCSNGAVKAESKEFPSKDALSLSYSIYYLPGKQSTLNYIHYIIIIPFRYRFS